MTTRRNFLAGASAVTAAAMVSAADRVAAQGASDLPKNLPGRTGRWRPEHRIGFGALPIGNAFFKTVSDGQALATVEAAWNAGVRLFDTSPSYGFGQSERRLGLLLASKPRDEFVLSSKIGRIMEPDSSLGVRDVGQWHGAPSFKYRYDYSADATRRSSEDSLQRLGVVRLDAVFVHDLTPGNPELGDWRKHLEIAKRGAFPTLEKMRQEGLIRGWGMGVNNPEPILAALEASTPDIMLAATQYSLIEHEAAMTGIMPAIRDAGASIMIGAPLNAGFLAGRDRFNYGGRPIPPAMLAKRARLAAVAGDHGVDLRVASLQFANANPVVSCVVPGASSADQAMQNVRAFSTRIPTQFWSQLRQERLIHPQAPVPA